MQQFIYQHWEAIAAILGMSVPSFIGTMPKPGTWQGWGTLYAWFYSFCQEILAIRSSKLAAGSEPQIRTNIPASTVSGGDESATFPATPTR